MIKPHDVTLLLRHVLVSTRGREIEERVDHFASGLEQEGLTPPNPDGMKLLALYSRNRPEWVIAEQVLKKIKMGFDRVCTQEWCRISADVFLLESSAFYVLRTIFW